MANKKRKSNINSIKNKKISTNRNLSQKNIYLKYIDRNFSLILLIMLAIMIILMFFNNLHLKKIIKVLDSKTETKEVVKKDKIIFLGDSITHRYDLKKYYDNKNIINQGVEGDTTEDIINRLQTSIYDYNVRKVILLIGTNDIGIGKDPIENIKLIINKIKSYDNSIEIIVESIYPINNTKNSKIKKDVVGTRNNEKTKENKEIVIFIKGKQNYIKNINKNIEKWVMKNSNIKVVDCYEFFEVKNKMKEVAGEYDKVLGTTAI